MPAAKARSTAVSMRSAAACACAWPCLSPSQSSIMAAERIMAVGFPRTFPLSVGGGAMTGLKYRMRVADIRRRRHAHSANEAGGKIREDIAKHVFHHHHIEVPWPAHQHGGAGVDVKPLGGDGWMARRAFVEDLA